MTETIKRQIEAIRKSGETNMLDTRMVQWIANRENYFELVPSSWTAASTWRRSPPEAASPGMWNTSPPEPRTSSIWRCDWRSAT